MIKLKKILKTKMPSIKFFPSLLSANFGNLQKEISQTEDFVDGFHFDSMDGHFVPNLTFGPPILAKLKSKKIFDAHLMLSNPEFFITDFAKAGAKMISIHAEITKNPAEVLSQIKKLPENILAGIVFNPDTKINFNLCEIADFVLIMSVFPGFGGQKFIAKSLEKVVQIRKKFPKKNIQIDGGINEENINEVFSSGANWIVSGSSFWHSKNLLKTAKIFHNNEY